MAHTILGIDLGDDSVRLAQLQAGFRFTRLLALYERPLLPPEGEEGLLERQIRTVRALCDEIGLQAEMTAAALGADTTVRVVSLPLSDPKKVEQVLPFELEGQLLGELEDQVIDYTVARTGLPQEDGQPGRGCRLVAAAAPKEKVRELIAALDQVGLEPRLVGAAALSCAALLQGARDEELPLAVLDMGPLTSHFCVVERNAGASGTEKGVVATFARSMGRGTVALTGGPWPASLKHLVRDLRQTLSSHASLYGAAPRKLLLVGRGALALGRDLSLALSAELGLEVRPLSLEDVQGAPWLAPPSPPISPDELCSCAPALGLALAVAGPAPQVNFRKGELAYRTDYSFLRQKAPHLLAATFAILFCAGLSALASLRGLERESEQLTRLLKSETTVLFGEAYDDGEAVSAKLNEALAGQKGGGQAVPSTSAFDLLEEISKTAPAGGNLEVVELNIRPKKTDLKATASSAQYVDELATALSKIACFKNVEKGKLVSAHNTGPDGKPVEVKQFTFNITSTCP